MLERHTQASRFQRIRQSAEDIKCSHKEITGSNRHTETFTETTCFLCFQLHAFTNFTIDRRTGRETCPV